MTSPAAKNLAAAVAALIAVSAAAGPLAPALIVFGDSTVDAGNNNRIPTLLKSDFPPYGRDFYGGRPTGRFSNGRLATDFYSEAFGLPPIVPAYLDPEYGIEDFAAGVCFASAGTGLDVATSEVLSVISAWQQVSYFREYKQRLASYLGDELADQTIAQAVYAISIGTNDFIENYFALTTPRFLEFTPDEYVNFLAGLASDFMAELYELGARRIGFTGLSPFGCVPLERSQNAMRCNQEHNRAARGFNARMVDVAGELNRRLPGLQMKVAEVYDFFAYIAENPSIYGFENTEKGCCGSGLFELGLLCDPWSFTCSDASKYIFWDAVHPTEAASRIIADYLLNTTFLTFVSP